MGREQSDIVPQASSQQMAVFTNPGVQELQGKASLQI